MMPRPESLLGLKEVEQAAGPRPVVNSPYAIIVTPGQELEDQVGAVARPRQPSRTQRVLTSGPRIVKWKHGFSMPSL